ncbi:hypothetical protein Pelo_10426 [Pelomyxa schiedti]|nr:hypothetical protein Pelo_10426 [Pelomyxa schiedti]
MSSIEEHLRNVTKDINISLLLHFDNIHVIEEKKYASYFGAPSNNQCVVNGVIVDTTQAQRQLDMWDCLAPCLLIPRVHIYLSGDTVAPLCVGYGMLGAEAAQTRFHHLCLDPLWPQDIRKASLSTCMQSTKVSIHDALGLNYTACRCIFEYTAGIPAVVHETFELLWMHKRANRTVDYTNETVLRNVMDTVVCASLVNKPFHCLYGLPDSIPDQALPLLSHVVALSSMGATISLSKPFFTQNTRVPFVYFLGALGAVFARGDSQDSCTLFWPKCVLRAIFRPVFREMHKIPFWKPAPFDPAVTLESPFLNTIGVMDVTTQPPPPQLRPPIQQQSQPGSTPHPPNNMAPSATESTPTAQITPTVSPQQLSTSSSQHTTFSDVYFFLRDTALAKIPFCAHPPLLQQQSHSGQMATSPSMQSLTAVPVDVGPVSDLLMEDYNVPVDRNQGTPHIMWKNWPQIRLYLLSKENDFKESKPPLTPSSVPRSRPQDKSSTTGTTGDNNSPTEQFSSCGGLDKCYSAWFQREDHPLGLSIIRAEVENFNAIVQSVTKRRTAAVLVIIALSIKERLAKLFNQDGYLYIPPGTHGINRSTGKLQSLSKEKLNELRLKSKHKAVTQFADSIEAGRKKRLGQLATNETKDTTNVNTSQNSVPPTLPFLMSVSPTSTPTALPSLKAPLKPSGKPKLPALNISAVKSDTSGKIDNESNVSRRNASKHVWIPQFMEVVLVNPQGLARILGVECVSALLAMHKSHLLFNRLETLLSSSSTVGVIDPSLYVVKQRTPLQPVTHVSNLTDPSKKIYGGSLPKGLSISVNSSLHEVGTTAGTTATHLQLDKSYMSSDVPVPTITEPSLPSPRDHRAPPLQSPRDLKVSLVSPRDLRLQSPRDLRSSLPSPRDHRTGLPSPRSRPIDDLPQASTTPRQKQLPPLALPPSEYPLASSVTGSTTKPRLAPVADRRPFTLHDSLTPQTLPTITPTASLLQFRHTGAGSNKYSICIIPEKIKKGFIITTSDSLLVNTRELINEATDLDDRFEFVDNSGDPVEETSEEIFTVGSIAEPTEGFQNYLDTNFPQDNPDAQEIYRHFLDTLGVKAKVYMQRYFIFKYEERLAKWSFPVTHECRGAVFENLSIPRGPISSGNATSASASVSTSTSTSTSTPTSSSTLETTIDSSESGVEKGTPLPTQADSGLNTAEPTATTVTQVTEKAAIPNESASISTTNSVEGKATNWRRLSRPFVKFFNFDETQCSVADTKHICENVASYCVQEKADGTCIQLYWVENEWFISTLGVIVNAKVFGSKDSTLTFAQSFMQSVEQITGSPFSFLCNLLDKRGTYLFELCSVVHPQITKYSTSRVYYLGYRTTLEGGEPAAPLDLSRIPGLRTPWTVPLSTFPPAALKSKRTLSNYCEHLHPPEEEGCSVQNREGFVLYCDGIPVGKIKHSAYMALVTMEIEFTQPKILRAFLVGNLDDVFSQLNEENRAFATTARELICTMQEEATATANLLRKSVSTSSPATKQKADAARIINSAKIHVPVKTYLFSSLPQILSTTPPEEFVEWLNQADKTVFTKVCQIVLAKHKASTRPPSTTPSPQEATGATNSKETASVQTTSPTEQVPQAPDTAVETTKPAEGTKESATTPTETVKRETTEEKKESKP